MKRFKCRVGRLAVDLPLGVALCCGCGAGDAPKAVEDATTEPTVEAAQPEVDADMETVEGVPADPGLLFDNTRVMEVVLELDPDDWAELRRQTRSMFDVLAGDCMAGPADSPYSWFEADLTLDGERMESVRVRKKGFIGSLNADKPGMKVDFDDLVDGRRVHGMERIALNNTPQDPTMVRTCLAYDHFERVGLPAPRCGFAHVTVNGEDLGIYATVQPVDDHFLAEHGVDGDAPLFEGTLSDFREGWDATFDPDSDAADPEWVQSVRDAVASGDLATISAVVDVDDFVRFWVAEAFMGHWDGYGWNTNNYYFYVDPADGLVRFVPWGTDAVWSTPYPGGGVDWIPLTGALARALVAHPEMEARYQAEVARQLSVSGGVDEALARIDAFADTISAWHRDGQARSDLEWIASYHLDTMSRAGGFEWPNPTGPLRDPFCMTERGTISYTFEGDWGSITGAAAPGACSGSYTWDGLPGSLSDGYLYVGPNEGWGVLACQHFGAEGGVVLMPYTIMAEDELAVGSVQTDHTMRYSTLYYTDDTMAGSWLSAAWVEGTLQVDALDPTGQVRGSFEGTLWSPPW